MKKRPVLGAPPPEPLYLQRLEATSPDPTFVLSRHEFFAARLIITGTFKYLNNKMVI